MNIIDNKLYEEIKEYCKLNHLKIGSYISSILRKAFNEDKFGKTPFDNNKIEEIKEEKESIRLEEDEIKKEKEEEIAYPKKEEKNKINKRRKLS